MADYVVLLRGVFREVHFDSEFDILMRWYRARRKCNGANAPLFGGVKGSASQGSYGELAGMEAADNDKETKGNGIARRVDEPVTRRSRWIPASKWFPRLSLTQRVWVQVCALIAVPSVVLAIGSAGVIFTRAVFDSRTLLAQVADAEAGRLGYTVKMVRTFVGALEEERSEIGRALAATEAGSVDRAVELASNKLFGLGHVIGIELVSGRMSSRRESPFSVGITTAPLVELGSDQDSGFAAVGTLADGKQVIRLDYRDPAWPADSTLRIFIDVSAQGGEGGAVPAADKIRVLSTLIVVGRGGRYQQVAWGSRGALLEGDIGEAVSLGESNYRQRDATLRDAFGDRFLGVVSRVPWHHAVVALRVDKQAVYLAPLVTAGVTLVSALLVTVLVAGRIAGAYLSTVDIVRTRALNLIRKIDPDWSGDVESVDGLVEIFDRLDGVVQGRHTRLTHEIEARTRSLEQTQERLLEASRLAAVGEILHGIMHEIGQPLNVLRLMIDDIEEDLKDGSVSVSAENLGRIRLAMERILRIQEGIRDRARPQHQDRQRIDLSALVSGTNSLYQVLSKQHGIRMVEIIAARKGGISVYGNETELAQCVSNLLINSIEALKEGPTDRRKEITVKLESTGGKAILTVEDNGPGMAKDAIARAFEVGFTTKRAGTGYGLNTCKRLIEVQHKGSIVIESEEGRFTRVTITLPSYPELDA